MEMEICLSSNQKIETQFKGATIAVGSDIGASSDEPHLEPLDLFFASLHLCVGKYVMEFCRHRDIPHEGTRILLRTQWDDKKEMHTCVQIQIQLPQEFPAKYRKAVLRTVDLCSVKKHILNPPSFQVDARIAS